MSYVVKYYDATVTGTAITDTLTLSEEERGLLAGDAGPARSLAMRVIEVVARTQRAERTIPITAAHVDSCLYHGPSSLDFVARLVAGGGTVRVPTTLNVGGLDLHRPDLFRGPPAVRDQAKALMEAYAALGCAPTYTCAPYQLPGRPAAGADVAWAESNAIVFGNSVIGLRTNRYGDLMDICAALVGRVPYTGLHVPENRAARAVFTVDPDALGLEGDLLPALLGHHVGQTTGTLVPAVDGLQPLAGRGLVDEDWSKAFGAAAASGGGVAMFHMVGVTPEAPDLPTATQGRPPRLERRVTRADLLTAHRELTSARADDRLSGVSLGTPHLSRAQLVDLADRLAGRRVRVPTYAATSRSVVGAEPDAAARLEESGVTVVRDTCIYGPTKVIDPDGAMMTDSGKWAYYAPAHLGYAVILAGRADCVASALAGRILVGTS